MNSQVYQDISHENLRPSVCQLKPNRAFVTTGSNLKHRSKTASAGEKTPFRGAQAEARPQPD